MRALSFGTMVLALVLVAVPARAEVRSVCADRQYRLWAPWMKRYEESWLAWEVRVCSQIETDGDTITLLADKPTVKYTVHPPFRPLWVFDDCEGSHTVKDDGTLWTFGSCQATWRSWLGPLPIDLASYTVAQEFTFHPKGHQDIMYPRLFKGRSESGPLPL